MSDAVAEIGSFFRVAGTLLLQGGILWMLYLVLESFGQVLARWPAGMVAAPLRPGARPAHRPRDPDRLRVCRRAHARRLVPLALAAPRRQADGRADTRQRSGGLGRIRQAVRHVGRSGVSKPADDAGDRNAAGGSSTARSPDLAGGCAWRGSADPGNRGWRAVGWCRLALLPGTGNGDRAHRPRDLQGTGSS